MALPGGVHTTQSQTCESGRGTGAVTGHVGMGVPQMTHWEEGDDPPAPG